MLTCDDGGAPPCEGVLYLTAEKRGTIRVAVSIDETRSYDEGHRFDLQQRLKLYVLSNEKYFFPRYFHVAHIREFHEQ
jgi:hypothetical protein